MTRVPSYTVAEVRAAEQPLLAAGEPLMARASAAIAGVVRDLIMADEGGRPRVLVLAGSGDNGGDALYAAAALTEIADVDVLTMSRRAHTGGLARALVSGAQQVAFADVRDAASRYAYVLDGILGIGAGADSALRGFAREVVEALLPAVRAGMPRVVAVDLPSGLQPDTGDADDAVLPAMVTVTFGGVKAGLVRGRGPELCGELVLVDIGLDIQRVEAEVTRVIEARG